MTDTAQITPLRIDIPDSDPAEPRTRLERVRWTDPDLGTDPGAHGAPLQRVRRLVAYWRDGYHWRRWEARLNAYPQFTTRIDGQNIQFLHVRSPEPDPFSPILTYGWPGSIGPW